MALGDYILCCKCEVKLIYDGDRGNREWWEERFGSEPEIMCPNCDKKKREWVGLTDEEIDELYGSPMELEHSGALKWVRVIEAKLKEKNT